MRDQVPFLCPICCEDSVTDVFLLLCGHEYCLPCYSQYVKASTRKGSLIRCMDVECNFAIVPSDVEFLLQASVAAPEPEADVSSESSASISSYDQQFERLDLLGRLVAHEPREPLLENGKTILNSRVTSTWLMLPLSRVPTHTSSALIVSMKTIFRVPVGL